MALDPNIPLMVKQPVMPDIQEIQLKAANLSLLGAQKRAQIALEQQALSNAQLVNQQKQLEIDKSRQAQNDNNILAGIQKDQTVKTWDDYRGAVRRSGMSGLAAEAAITKSYADEKQDREGKTADLQSSIDRSERLAQFVQSYRDADPNDKAGIWQNGFDRAIKEGDIDEPSANKLGLTRNTPPGDQQAATLMNFFDQKGTEKARSIAQQETEAKTLEASSKPDVLAGIEARGNAPGATNEQKAAGQQAHRQLAILKAQEKTGQSVDQQEMSDWLRKNPGKGPSDFLLWKNKNSPAMIVQQANQAATADVPVLTTKPVKEQFNTIEPKTGLTYGGIWQNATKYAMTGQMPSVGMGSNPIRMARQSAIMNAASAQAEAAGTDLPTVQAEYKANAGSLNQMTKLYNATAAAADTAKDSIILALNTSKNLPRTQMPAANRFLNWARGELTGNPTLSGLEVNIYTAAREYAKVTTGAAASIQGVTDSGMKAADRLINAAQNPAQFKQVTDQMINDMNIVQTNQNKQIGKISSTIANFLRVSAGGAEATVGNAPQMIRARDPQGKLHEAPEGTALPKGWTLEK